MKMKNINFYW